MNTLDDPQAFADALYNALGEDGDPRIIHHAPAQLAAFEAAMTALKERYPQDIGFAGPVTVADEAGFTWANACHEAGIKFGIAAETLRRSLLDPAG